MTAVTTGLPFPSGAVEVLSPAAARDVWLAERRASIGGSDASLLAGVGYGSRMTLWLDKTGRLPEQPRTSAMEWGTLLEPLVVDWLAGTYQLRVVRAGLLRRPDEARMHANPDGIEVDELGRPVAGIEAKTTTWRLAYQWADGQLPDHAELQAQWCMYVTGLPRWWVVGLIDGREPQVRMVHADPALQQTLSLLAEQFWTQHVAPDAAPALDGSSSTLEAIRAWLSSPDPGKVVELDDELAALFTEWDHRKSLVKQAEQDRDETECALRIALGDAEQVVDDIALPADQTPAQGGRTVYATAICNGAFSEKRLREAHPDVADEFTTLQPALDLPALKAGRPEVYQQHRARQIRTRRTLTDRLAEIAAAKSPTDEEL